MAEIATADGSGGVTVQSPQTDPTPKSGSDRGSETIEPSSEKPKRSKITTKAPKAETNARGVVKTQWDNPAADPNLRKHVGEDPTGKSNVIT